MAKQKQGKKVAKYRQEGSTVKSSHVPTSFQDSDRNCPVWRYRYVDLEGPFSWRRVTDTTYHDHVIRCLRDYELVKWGEIGNRAHCHPMPIEKCEPAAQTRWEELGYDYESLYQLKLDGECRIYGIRVQEIYYLLWYDPGHCVYKVKTGKYADK